MSWEAISALCAVGTFVLVALVPKIVSLFRGHQSRKDADAERQRQFLDDWNGVPDRPGVPGRPGLMVRLNKQDEILSHILHEMSPNSQRSMKDTIDRIDRRTTDIEAIAQEARNIASRSEAMNDVHNRFLRKQISAVVENVEATRKAWSEALQAQGIEVPPSDAIPAPRPASE